LSGDQKDLESTGEGLPAEMRPEDAVSVLVGLKTAAPAELFLEADALHVRGGFGELVVPYARIRQASRGMPANVTLQVAGAQILFDVMQEPTIDAMLALIRAGARAASQTEHEGEPEE
jgi:hypothetical protein